MTSANDQYDQLKERRSNRNNIALVPCSNQYQLNGPHNYFVTIECTVLLKADQREPVASSSSQVRSIYGFRGTCIAIRKSRNLKQVVGTSFV